MFKSIVFYRSLRSLRTVRPKHLNPIIGRHFSSSDNESDDKSISEQLLSDNKSELDENESKDLSFAKAFAKFDKLSKESEIDSQQTDSWSQPFPTLLRYSPFIQLGDPEGKVVVGRIEDIIEDDLYIDFGHKFNAVCKRPKSNHSDYVRGAKVKLRINDLELSDRFLGSNSDMTLLEADATLMGIIWSPIRSTDRKTGADINVDSI